MVLLLVPPNGLVFVEAMLQFVSSSGLSPHLTTCFPKINGLSTWKFTTRSLTEALRIKFLGTEYEREIFLITQNEPSLYCIAEVKLVTPELGIGHSPSQKS